MASIQVSPGNRIDVFLPPGICIPRMSDMDAHHSTVSAALVANSDAEMLTKARSDVSADAVLASTLRQIPGSKLLAKEGVCVITLLRSNSALAGLQFWCCQRTYFTGTLTSCSSRHCQRSPPGML